MIVPESNIPGRKRKINVAEAVLQLVTQLPPFPAVLHRVLHMVEDPKSSAQDLVEVIQYDQAITANVLRVCNSAYFSFRRPVNSLRDALVRIGFNHLIEIVLTRESAPLFRRAGRGDPYAGELWRHSVAVALASQILAPRTDRSPAQFTTALLHDIGKIILSHFVKLHFTEIQQRVREGNLSFSQAEKEVLGIDHAELGGKISEKWKFPGGIVAGIRLHHNPSSAKEHREMVFLVHLSDLIALWSGFGGGSHELTPETCEASLQEHQLTKEDLDKIIPSLEREMKRVERFLTSK